LKNSRDRRSPFINHRKFMNITWGSAIPRGHCFNCMVRAVHNDAVTSIAARLVIAGVEGQVWLPGVPCDFQIVVVFTTA
jgi:hypothetical protein